MKPFSIIGEYVEADSSSNSDGFTTFAGYREDPAFFGVTNVRTVMDAIVGTNG